MAVSQGLETTEFSNLVGLNRYWLWSRFSHLDRLHYGWKSVNLKYEYWLFSSTNISGNDKKPDEKEK